MDTINKSPWVETADGSRTLYHEASGEHYHSRHGAVSESKHVFVGMGLNYCHEQIGKRLRVLEVGFGTGLNFLLSAAYALEADVELDYKGVEAYPLALQRIQQLGYERYVPESLWTAFSNSYPQTMNFEQISLQIVEQKILDTHFERPFDLLYFDAFSAIHQPEMWTPEVLAHVINFLSPGGVFVTYSITGSLKRTLKALGMRIEKLPGAPGKREMLRAMKVPG